MVVHYFGENCFRIENGSKSLLIDPNSNRLKGDVVLRTSISTETPVSNVGEICYPGEYEIGGIEIEGWMVDEESSDKSVKTVYVARWDDVSFAFLGSIRGEPKREILESFGGIDLLFLPMSGRDSAAAAKFSKELEPAVILPYDGKQMGDFLKKLGQSAAPQQDKFVFKKKDIAGKPTSVIVLEPASKAS